MQGKVRPFFLLQPLEKESMQSFPFRSLRRLAQHSHHALTALHAITSSGKTTKFTPFPGRESLLPAWKALGCSTLAAFWRFQMWLHYPTLLYIVSWAPQRAMVVYCNKLVPWRITYIILIAIYFKWSVLRVQVQKKYEVPSLLTHSPCYNNKWNKQAIKPSENLNRVWPLPVGTSCHLLTDLCYSPSSGCCHHILPPVSFAFQGPFHTVLLFTQQSC